MIPIFGEFLEPSSTFFNPNPDQSRIQSCNQSNPESSPVQSRIRFRAGSSVGSPAFITF